MKNFKVLLLIVMVSIMATGCLEELMFPRHSLEREYTGPIEVPEWSEFQLQINSRNGSISVKPTRGDEFYMDVFYQVRAASRNEAREILEDEVDFQKGSDYIHFAVDDTRISARVVLRVPQNYHYSMDLNSSNGGIYLEGLECLNVRMETSNGRIELTDLYGEEVVGRSSNGSLKVTNFVGNELDLRTSNGNADIVATAPSIDIVTSNGRVTLRPEFLENGELNVSTSNGGIKAYLPEAMDIGYNIKARTSNGNVDVFLRDLNIIDRNEYQTHNFADLPIQVFVDLTTSNGDILIDKQL